jgi:hypothetical protein
MFRNLLTLLFIAVLGTCVSAQKRIWVADIIKTDGVQLEGLAKTAADVTIGDSTKLVTAAAVKGAIAGLGGGTGADFDPTRPILRLPGVGDTVTGIAWYYFAPPTMSLSLSPSTTLYEWGTVNGLNVQTNTQNPAGTTLANGRTEANSSQIGSFGANPSASMSYTFQPGAGSGNNATSYAFRSYQDFSGSGESGTIQSNSRSVKGVYPVLYGVNSSVFGSGTSLYTGLTKSIRDQGDATLALNGSGYIYYAFPATWSISTLTEIIDGSGFNNVASYTVETISVTSTGLANNWTQDYVVYRLNSLTTVDASYIFKD